MSFFDKTVDEFIGRLDNILKSSRDKTTISLCTTSLYKEYCDKHEEYLMKKISDRFEAKGDSNV